MRRSGRWAWFFFGICCLAIGGALVWMSNELLDLERQETRARNEAAFQQRLRLALWRMDQRCSAMLARESERPHTDYEAFRDVERQVFTKRDLQQIADDELLVPSPLLTDKPEFVQLYWNVDPRGVFSSPQVPQSVYRELAVPKFLNDDELSDNAGLLNKVEALVELPDLAGQVLQAEETTRTWQSANVQGRRAQIASQAKQARQTPRRAATATLGPLEPTWQGKELLFVRRVKRDEEFEYQGFLADLPKLRATLLEEITDLFPDATLRPLVAEESDRQLFTLPVVLETPRPSVSGSRWTASHTVLAVTWTAVLLAGIVAAATLRRSIAFGEKQRRFASLVTHELRSPLTTFRLYSDLLAEKLVTDEEKRDVYHRTLQKESDTMARMVENVIALSRVEDGRTQLRCQRLTVGNLIDQVSGDLTACAERSGLTLSIEAGGIRDVALETDPGAVGQILLNLVENACKYGKSEERPAIRIGASVHDRTLKLTVRDRGPGVPPEVAKGIFRPFERGEPQGSEPVRALGLGLALSRGLARDLGGDLALENPADGGASFVVSLPVP